MQTLNDIAEKFAMARGPDSMCPVLELGTVLQRRHKLLHKMAPRFHRIRDKIQMDIDLNGQKWTNKMMFRAYLDEEEREKAKLNKELLETSTSKVRVSF